MAQVSSSPSFGTAFYFFDIIVDYSNNKARSQLNFIFRGCLQSGAETKKRAAGGAPRGHGVVVAGTRRPSAGEGRLSEGQLCRSAKWTYSPRNVAGPNR
jgi:hypothetical protein